MGEATPATFCSVVVNHVKNHFDAVAMQLPNRGLELANNVLGSFFARSRSRVPGVCAKEVDGVVDELSENDGVAENEGVEEDEDEEVAVGWPPLSPTPSPRPSSCPCPGNKEFDNSDDEEDGC